MNINEAFNTIFSSGFNFEQYKEMYDKEKLRKRLESNWQYVDQQINNLPSDLLDQLNQPMKILCIGESWCSDCANAIPVIANLSQRMTNWEFRINSRDEFGDIIEMYYQSGGRSKIPAIIFADQEGNEIIRWVERPARSYLLLADLKAKNLDKEEYSKQFKATEELMGSNLTAEILREIIECANKAAQILRLTSKQLVSH